MKATDKLQGVYQDAASKRFKELAAPLDLHFGIDEFIYVFISNEGTYFAISTQPEPHQFYFDSELYKGNPLIRHPSLQQEGTVLLGAWHAHWDADPIGEKFGYWRDTAFVINRQSASGTHRFVFNTKKHDVGIVDFYATNLALFEKFCDYFLSEWSRYQSSVDKYAVDAVEIVGADFYKKSSSEDLLANSPDVASKEAFFKKIGVLPKDFAISKPFSRGEQACLKLLSQGLTMKDAATKLHLSTRTVEHYLENLKNKTGCSTKSELMEYVSYLKLLGTI